MKNPTAEDYDRWLRQLDVILESVDTTDPPTIMTLGAISEMRMDILRTKFVALTEVKPFREIKHKLPTNDDFSDLPPMVPLKDINPDRILAAQSVQLVPCPTCKKGVGKPCVKLTSRGPHGKPTNEPLMNPAEKGGSATVHKSRNVAAREELTRRTVVL